MGGKPTPVIAARGRGGMERGKGAGASALALLPLFFAFSGIAGNKSVRECLTMTSQQGILTGVTPCRWDNKSPQGVTRAVGLAAWGQGVPPSRVPPSRFARRHGTLAGCAPVPNLSGRGGLTNPTVPRSVREYYTGNCVYAAPMHSGDRCAIWGKGAAMSLQTHSHVANAITPLLGLHNTGNAGYTLRRGAEIISESAKCWWGDSPVNRTYFWGTRSDTLKFLGSLAASSSA